MRNQNSDGLPPRPNCEERTAAPGSGDTLATPNTAGNGARPANDADPPNAAADTNATAGQPQIDPNEAARLAINLTRDTGWSVFPVRVDKKPATPHGYKDATNDANAIAKLWRRWPGPLIGVATGAVSGLDVLDLDVKHAAALGWWLANEHRLPDTRTFRSRSGGIHLYHQHSAGVGCSSGRLAAGVDIRGDGGYIIFWFAAGLPYLDHTPPAPWPEWLFDLILPKSRASTPAVGRQAIHTPRGIEGLLRTVERAAEGQRNAALFWASCRLAERVQGGQIGAGEAERALLDAARHAGLPEIEAKATIRSALARGVAA